VEGEMGKSWLVGRKNPRGAIVYIKEEVMFRNQTVMIYDYFRREIMVLASLTKYIKFAIM